MKLAWKPRYELVQATLHALIFKDVNAPGIGVTWFVMPRHRWESMCMGRWPR